MTISPDTFRAIVGSFPTGVTVVTALSADGEPKGLTTNAFCSVSEDPALLLVCVSKYSNTLGTLRGAGAFVVNFLAEDRDHLSARFASKGGDKFAGVEWRPSAIAGGAPILAGDVAAFAECVVEREIDAGDHWILLGRVKHGEVTANRPLMYYRRQYGAWPKARPDRSDSTLVA